MGFDVQNFGFGLIAGWISAYGVYRARHQIGQVVRSAQGQAESARGYATRSADGRYINDLIDRCETTHLGGMVSKLSQIIVEPRFLPARPLAAPPDDEIIASTFEITPQIHDLPFLHAPYNVETLSIADLAAGDRAIALLGLPGSGRTTALLSIALHSLGQLSFQEAADKVQRNLDAEEASLSDKERAARVKERQKIEELARERLKDDHGIVFEALSQQARRGGTAFQRLMPVYVHLANVTLNPAEFGSEIDPAEPLVRAVQSQVGRVTASTLPRHLYRRLSDGETLLLIDGYDDLPKAERERKLIWLRQLRREYGDNFFVVAGPARGFNPLTEMGLAPVFMRPWDNQDIQTAIERWATAWPRIAGTGRRAAPPPDPALIERARTSIRALLPAEITLKVWAALADDAPIPGYEGWLRAFLVRHMPKQMEYNALLPQMTAAAAVQLDSGFVTARQLEEIAAGRPAGEAVETVEEAPTKDKKAEKKEESDQSKFLSSLQRSGLLVTYRGGRYQFRHAFLAAYLASHTLSSPATLQEKAEQVEWQQAVAYAVMHTPLDALIQPRLQAQTDLLQNKLFDAARWLAYTSSSVAWGGALLKYLGNLLIAPNQYPLIQERAAAALIATRDKKTLFVFRQAARSANPSIRLLACFGMGAIGETEAIPDLSALLTDDITEVQLAAAMALGAIGTEDALEAIVLSLMDGSERLRQAVAETLAANPDEGHPVLYDAINHDDMMVRRAAAFGLGRLRTAWSVHSLYRTFLEDDQWYVRSAAQQAFQEIQSEGHRGPRAYPTPEMIPWLAAWASQRGEGIPAGEGAYQVLVNALQEGPPEIRTLSALAIGQVGHVTGLKPLYGALRDRQEEVRSAAHRALGEFEVQLDQPLPTP